MAVDVWGAIPADELAMHYVLTPVPNVSLAVERILESGEESMMPLGWVCGADRETVEAAIAADPTVSES